MPRHGFDVAGDALLDLGEVLPQAALAHHRAHPVPPLGSSRWPSRHWTQLSTRNTSFAACHACAPPLEIPLMREMAQVHSTRRSDAGLAWLRSRLRELAG